MRSVTALALLCLFVFAGAATAGEVHDAAAAGELESVRALVSADATQLEARNERNEMPIHVAAAGGHTDVVRFLLDGGAAVDAGDNENSTALDVAAIFGHLELARFLVERGADPRHSDDNGMTPLHFACYNGNADIGRYLIEQGADVRATTNSGSTPLHGAGYDGSIDCIELLLDGGALVDARNAAGFTPVLSASAGTAGADAVARLVEGGADVHDRNYNGESALMFAARMGKPDVVEYLLEAGASITARNDAGWTALLNATEGGNVEAVTLLLDGGADPNSHDAYGRRVLWWAALRGHTDVVRLLIERGADVNAEPPDGMTALMRALSQGHFEVSELLLDGGVDVNAADPDMGRTALHAAALHGWPDFVELLLAKGADPKLKDSYGMTALGYAGKYGHKGVADMLKANGAPTGGLVENYGRCPLLDRKADEGQASMWYLGHCGWALKTKEHFLVFDYWNGAGAPPETPCITNGRIDPSEISDENVYVFVTHEHADHYDPVINEWGRALDNVTYVYGFRPELTQLYRESGYDGPEYEYVGPREYRELGDLTIRTIEANDSGVGFLIEVDGLKLYHAGDHAGWADDERDGFFAEINYLEPYAEDLDIAFINVTGCHAHDPERLLEGNVYALETLGPNVLIPTHAIDREYVYAEAADALAGEGVTTAVCCPMNRGDNYFYDGSTMK
jgi:ankyrin repeat protein/L-ascorbate metabolism protein UlaG (beta-lactamase superfamily)